MKHFRALIMACWLAFILKSLMLLCVRGDSPLCLYSMRHLHPPLYVANRHNTDSDSSSSDVKELRRGSYERVRTIVDCRRADDAVTADTLWALDKWSVNDSDVSIHGQEFVELVIQKRTAEQRAEPFQCQSPHTHPAVVMYAGPAERAKTNGVCELLSMLFFKCFFRTPTACLTRLSSVTTYSCACVKKFVILKYDRCKSVCVWVFVGQSKWFLAPNPSTVPVMQTGSLKAALCSVSGRPALHNDLFNTSRTPASIWPKVTSYSVQEHDPSEHLTDGPTSLVPHVYFMKCMY